MTQADRQPSADGAPRSRSVGWAAACISVLIGVAWQLSTRVGASSSLTPADLMLIRYVVPALLMLPWLVRWGFWPIDATLSSARLITLIAFSGLVYGIFSYNGAKYAPVAHMGALVPGTMPMFVAGLAWLCFRERPSWGAWAAMGVMAAGVVLVSGGSQWGTWLGNGSSAVLFGDALFLMAALNWAIYMTALRGVTVQPLHLVALVAFWNAPFAAALWYFTPETKLMTASFATLAWQVPVQGIVAAIGGNYVFLIAMRHLGSVTAAATGAAVPAGVALGGVFVLREPLSAATIVGVTLTVLGIWALQAWGQRKSG